jgi:hypothetical protein
MTGKNNRQHATTTTPMGNSVAPSIPGRIDAYVWPLGAAEVPTTTAEVLLQQPPAPLAAHADKKWWVIGYFDELPPEAEGLPNRNPGS